MGADEGAPVIYHWTMPSLMPLLLPWLGVLGLLAARPNRTGRAWWIWAPVLLVAGAALALRFLVGVIGPVEEVLDMFGQVALAVGFGLAAVWLLGFLFARQHGLLVFLGVLLIQCVVSAAVLLASIQADNALEQVGFFIFLLLAGAGIALALALAGQARRRLRLRLGFPLWTLIFLLAMWLLGISPFIVLSQLSGGFAPAGGMLIGALCVGAASFALLAPFLILASANAFYRERLQAMFGIPTMPAASAGIPQAPPPPLPPRLEQTA